MLLHIRPLRCRHWNNMYNAAQLISQIKLPCLIFHPKVLPVGTSSSLPAPGSSKWCHSGGGCQEAQHRPDDGRRPGHRWCRLLRQWHHQVSPKKLVSVLCLYVSSSAADPLSASFLSPFFIIKGDLLCVILFFLFSFSARMILKL